MRTPGAYLCTMASVIDERQAEIAEEFAMFGDWMEKYEHIISLGKELDPLDPEDKVDENLIKGCQSRVWLAAKRGDDGQVVFTADSDAIITKGLAALMIRLSPTRSNGLQSMVKQMKLYGLAFTASA
jgi:cysteine desulfuration protein SufE